MTDGIRPAGIEFARIVNGFAVLLSALAPALVLGYDDTEQQALAAAISFLMVATPVAVGIYAQRSEGTRRFGRQLVLVGCGLFVTTLGHSDSDLLYTVARIDGWLMEVAIIYVLCAYPTGRLTERAERFTVAAAAILIAALYLPTIPVAEFPAPSPWSTCTADCPSNAFMSGGSTPALVADVIQPLRGLLAALVFLSAALALARRVRRASPLARTSLTPVLGVAIIRFSAEAGFILLRATDLPDDVVATVAMVINLTIPIVAAGFLVGLLRWRLRVARALEGLYGRLGTATDPGGLQTMLRECLEDPELRIYLPEPGRPRHWRDAAGAPYDAEVEGRPGRSLSEVDAGGGLTALVCCDVAISEQRSLLEGVSRTVASFLEHDRLTRALESSLDEIEASRTRIAAAADAARRRIERDLHDGTQQRLIALRIRLELIDAQMTDDPGGAQAMLREIGPEVEEVISEVRDLSRGIYPPLLVEAGPAEALRGIATRLPVEAEVSGGIGRREEEVEAAIYFCCVEAIQNAIKHGRDLGRIEIAFSEDDRRTSFEVVDDGGGFEPCDGDGSGVTNMHDRLAVVGGVLHVSRCEGGTRVRGEIPRVKARRTAPQTSVTRT